MSPLARWCHRHRLAVVLAWVGLLIALGGAVGAIGSSFGNSPTSLNTDSAKAAALLQKAASSAAGKSGRVVWQVRDGKVTDPASERPMADAVKRIETAPAWPRSAARSRLPVGGRSAGTVRRPTPPSRSSRASATRRSRG